MVVYCAQDQEFAEGVFADFQAEADLAVAPKFDTEANKSVGLAAELQAGGRPAAVRRPLEQRDPRHHPPAAGRGCTSRTRARRAAGYPDWAKAKDRTWQAFAARARVLIVNTNLVPEADRPKSLLDLTDPKWKGKVAMAKPQFGTTATQAACLFEVLGPDAAKAFYRGLKANGVQIVPGNKQSARGVADGQFAVGHDRHRRRGDRAERRQAGGDRLPRRGRPPGPPADGHAVHPEHGGRGEGLPEPGRGEEADRLPAEARRRRAKLAEGGGFQIPLNPRVKADLHPALKTRHEVKPMEVDFEKAADLWDESQAFLREVFAR